MGNLKGKATLLVSTSLILFGCESNPINGYFAPIPASSTEVSVVPGPTSTPTEPVSGPTNTPPSPEPSATPSVCFQPPATGAPNAGLVATLSYLPFDVATQFDTTATDPSKCSWNYPSNCPGGLGLDYAYFASNAKKIPLNVYFSSVDVPTEEFTEGFPGPGPSASPLVDGSGQVLTSYFALDFKGQIQLDSSAVSNDDPLGGEYQFATISDDGSILLLDTTGTGALSTVVDNDYWHGDILGCAPETVNMKPGVPISMELQYFQGAPVQIGIMILWREIKSNSGTVLHAVGDSPYCWADSVSVDSAGDPESSSSFTYCSGTGCQNKGGPAYFNVNTTPSTQLKLFTDMLADGWNVLTVNNYLLPPNSNPNPCVTPGPTSPGGTIGE